VAADRGDVDDGAAGGGAYVREDFLGQAERGDQVEVQGLADGVERLVLGRVGEEAVAGSDRAMIAGASGRWRRAGRRTPAIVRLTASRPYRHHIGRRNSLPDICTGRLVGGIEKNSSIRRELTMKAIRAREGTGISGLVLDEVPDPRPNFCEVLVKVAACGITHNELDWPIWTCRAGHQRATVIPGHEVSGVVAGLGFGTAGLAVGDEVFGLTDQLRDGAAAEYVAVEARNLALKPQTVDHVRAAAVPRAGLTAWQGLFEHGKLVKGQTVVIHGAGGAVGSMAVQLARWAGAEVIGTGRGHSRQLVTELGADRYIALDADRLEEADGQADLVFDTIGGEVIGRSPALLKPGGTLVTIRADAQLPAGRDDISTIVFIQESSRAQLAELARLVDEGHLRPQAGEVYPLARAVEAYSAKAAGGIPGRTILQP
jgi:NADPH:quinone reductase-like Zn-dependent oxidoreductase